MASRGELYSARVDGEGGHRYYFFNIKTDRNGTLFLTIVESTKRPQGDFIRNEIFLYDEDVKRFSAEMRSTLQRFDELRSARAARSATPMANRSRDRTDSERS